MNINSLVPIAVVFVVAAFTISIGSTIMEDASETFCDGTWITNTTQASGLLKTNPIYSASYGCCDATGAGGGNNCTSWNDDASLNSSGQGILSMEELSSWLPTLALVIIAAIIIGVLVTYLARGAGGTV